MKHVRNISRVHPAKAAFDDITDFVTLINSIIVTIGNLFAVFGIQPKG